MVPCNKKKGRKHEISDDIYVLFLVKDMQSRPSPTSQKQPFLVQNDAQCSETNEKSIFRFLRILFFENCSILFFIIRSKIENFIHLAKENKMCNVLKLIFVFLRFFCVMFPFLDIYGRFCILPS